MKERSIGRIATHVLFAAVLAGCAKPPMETSYQTSAYVKTLEDRANPIQNSSEGMFASISDWVEGESQTSLSVPLSKFFVAGCHIDQTIIGGNETGGDLIRGISLKIGGRVIKEFHVSNPRALIFGIDENVRAAQLPLGVNIIICEFETWGGKLLTSEASVEVTDDRA